LRTPPARDTAPEEAGLAAWATAEEGIGAEDTTGAEEAAAEALVGALVTVTIVVDEQLELEVAAATAEVAFETTDEAGAWDFGVGTAEEAADEATAELAPLARAADAPPKEKDCVASPAAQGA
jgi:hypothetical protein